ncbi:MAG: hypothetical protein ACOCW8_02360 [bacterium]
MKGEKWETIKLVKMARELQPGIVIDNRLGGSMELEDPGYYAGDFEGSELVIPKKPIEDEAGRRIPWEPCITL